LAIYCRKSILPIFVLYRLSECSIVDVDFDEKESLKCKFADKKWSFVTEIISSPWGKSGLRKENIWFSKFDPFFQCIKSHFKTFYCP